MDKKILVNFDNVGLRYSHSNEALKDINFTLRKGDFVFLIGDSGAGKTTFLNLIHIGLIPSRGFLQVLGKDVHQITHQELSDVRRKIGVIFQDFRLINHISVFENIALPLKIMKFKEPQIKERVEQMLSWIELSEYRNILPINLSGGQKQKVAIARAVINNPEIILADEPTGSIDETMANKILTMLEELNKNDVSIIFSTHNAEIIKNTNHNIALIQNNKLQIIKDAKKPTQNTMENI